jgi:hypothetical protein
MTEEVPSAAEEAVLKWMMNRLLNADIVHHYFDLKQSGEPVPETEAIFFIIQKLMLGSCGFLSSAISRQAGQDHLVWIYSAINGSLMHSVIACSPQHENGVLKGSYVDLLGRGRFGDLIASMEDIAGGVRIEIGGPISSEDYLDGEEDALIVLAKAMPWTRQFMGMSRSGEDAPSFTDALVAVGNFKRSSERIYTAEDLSSRP